MHLLTAQAGGIIDGSEPVDLEQSPADIVILTSADTEIAGLAAAKAALGPSVPSLRLANLLQLTHNFSVDLYIEKTLTHAKLIIVRVLGGPNYWHYGLEEVRRIARARAIKLATISGAAYADPALDPYCTLGADQCERIWNYLVEGGPSNLCNMLRFCSHLIGEAPLPCPPEPLPKAGAYWPKWGRTNFEDLRRDWAAALPCAAITFYRALLQGGDLAPVDELVAKLTDTGLNALPIFVSSPKDRTAAELVRALLNAANAEAVINLTAFAISKPGDKWSPTILDDGERPVFQAILSGSNRTVWRKAARGLNARDVAMNIALPEVDGRIITRAISFKADNRRDDVTETGIVAHRAESDRVTFVAALVANWVRLKQLPVEERRVAIILSNYPTGDGHIGNGVGLDTPAGTLVLLQAMKEAGYGIGHLPDSGDALMDALKSRAGSPGTHDVAGGGADGEAIAMLSLDDYERALARLAPGLRAEIDGRWGPPQADPQFASSHGAFMIGAIWLGRTLLAVQPGRGQGLDPKDAHHDQTIVPPHHYLAFYFWIREKFGAHAVIHMGKHGNLEWLPGKALALSPGCYPEAALGPLPHIYPFIVNDPGEGSQAKRRTGAVIIDHLMPPLTRAETYGDLRHLEVLVDEYYEAASLDPRRTRLLGKQILDAASASGVNRDCGIERSDSEDDALAKLDNFLCDLKELQIRDGLHIFGKAPQGNSATDLLISLTRLDRGDGKGRNASLLRALSRDLELGAFDPLDVNYSYPWKGPRPDALQATTTDPWRSHGDTLERLELLARLLVSGARPCPAQWPNANSVLTFIEHELRPKVAASVDNEIANTLRALDGRFVEPGPAGAPTRGRLDVLPTGRNFFSTDTRTIPTKAAWELAKLSAEELVTVYRQDHGEWPRSFVISAWGTANMRTGGDDIAQALALIGAMPKWEDGSRRVIGYEILSLAELARPRIDVTFRISGFFRDAFPAQIDLLDSAIRAVASRDEPADANPIAAKVQASRDEQRAAGQSLEAAEQRAGARIFGSAPGRYGAGIKDIVIAGNWETREQLASAYMAAGSYSYGAGEDGAQRADAFASLLAATDAVVQNQDTREFDLLDSSDFFQFEGGAAAAIAELAGRAPAIYHNDHSRPERPVIRRLEDEIARIVRGRAANPKWIGSAKRHGYKGASEMAATVANLIGFAATTEAVGDHHFEALFEAYIVDPDTRSFLDKANPDALVDMAKRLCGAIERGLWQPRRNSAYGYLTALAGGADRQ